MKILTSRLLVILAVVVLWHGSSEALVIDGFDAERHERFSNDSDFIGDSDNWSGVGRNGTWATMVSDSFFVSASHSHPGNGASITFYHGNNAAGASDTRETHTVGQGWRIDGSDLWLGRLGTSTTTSSVSSSVAKYGIADISLSNSLNSELYVFGTGTVATTTTGQRVGSNLSDDTISGFNDSNLNGTGNVFLYDFDVGVADEARVVGGDSGAPSFLMTDSDPLLLGIHWFRYEDLSTTPGTLGSGDTFVPSYISQMNALMSPFGQSLTVVSVPEPSVFLGTGVALLLAGMRRRRRID